jgi:uncharacterized protein (DUF952 family)
MIYHVVAKSQWEQALAQGFYEAPSLAIEGFIHLSMQNQVQGVLNRYYQGQNDLLLLHVEENKLTAPLKLEIAPSVNEEFPHLFGPLNIDAVVNVTAVESGL